MTRGELVAELLGLWEESVQKMKVQGYDEAAGEIRTAIGVLEKTYNVDELITPDHSYCEEND